ncbi:MAG TPA: NADP-dependent oxidoreductase, partial [Stenotrophomonas sp.]|nr:NADP-dependent oxidoreductase [Stenotrophomonas sp.]
AVMEGRTVSDVIASNHPGIAVGARVVATGNWQTHAVVEGDSITRTLADTGLPASTALGVHGMPGFTAYAGLQEIG